ncbi:MAG: putative baseplate assembly protein [Gammaproteobacteria bacterium]|nr:putative baseplate assembly protein [Gammaproteobacteria bacterium]
MRGRNDINGIDFLEVIDREEENQDLRQRRLRVHLLNPHSGVDFAPDNVRIEGGERVKNIQVQEQGVTLGVDNEANVLTIEVDRPGDFSTYSLRLLRSVINNDERPPENFDPVLSSVAFSFKVECPTDFDCKDKRICPPELKSKPPIDYLAKDYASFRRLMLDRMAALQPDWQERHAADLGITLVELLANTADYLSYQQDAVATEAYLGTARRRVSVRRHARLVDYFISDGSNARTWVQIQAAAQVVIPAGTALATRIPGQAVNIATADAEVLKKAQLVFETMHVIELFTDHDEINFYTWSDEHCCLPERTTRATLNGHFPNLQAHDEEQGIMGNVLVFEETIGPETGNQADADLQRRHAVLLTSVTTLDDENNPLTDPVTDLPITEIEWAAEDALPFALCISASVGQGDENLEIGDISVARGNIVLADHGRTVIEPPWDPVPEARLKYAPKLAEDRCTSSEPELIPIRYSESLKQSPVTQAAEFEAELLKSASQAMHWKQYQVLPDMLLLSDQIGEGNWNPKRDLLNSDEDEQHFVVETETEGIATLRFGDDKQGKRPNAGTQFTPEYRVGNGSVGNIAVDSLVHILSNIEGIIQVRNLTSGQGGSDAESIEDVRLRAPYAFRTQERAVTQQDYQEVTERHPGIQQVAATPRWTGSWYTWFLTIDRKAGLEVDSAFENDIRAHVERYRMAGYDLEVDGPLFVPLEIEMFICVKAQYFRSDVKQALLAVFNNQRLKDGRLGVFHPDNFTFGQTVYLSPLYAKAQQVSGVASVECRIFKRQRVADLSGLDTGKLAMNRLEIPRLDNNRNFPERGVFRLQMGGGK